MDAEFRGVHYPKYEAAEDSEDHNSKEKYVKVRAGIQYPTHT